MLFWIFFPQFRTVGCSHHTNRYRPRHADGIINQGVDAMLEFTVHTVETSAVEVEVHAVAVVVEVSRGGVGGS